MFKALLLGLLASAFFAFTFVLNRQMNLSGGHWIWSAVLRFGFMLPILFAMLWPCRKYRPVLAAIKTQPFSWLLWSTVGFGIFYSFVCLASTYGPSWLMAATWQITIIAGILLTPLFFTDKTRQLRRKIPKRQLFGSLVILGGIVLIQGKVFRELNSPATFPSLLFMIIAAFAYPLGNRKMMETADSGLNTPQRVFGMTLCSLPFWLTLSAIGLLQHSTPNLSQVIQSLAVAIFSGVIATLLFFKATDLVRKNVRHLAIIESTQAGEVVFTLLGGVLLFGDLAPSVPSLIGMAIVVLGIVVNALFSTRFGKTATPEA